MVLAAVRDDTYNVFLFIHIVAFLVAFASILISPMLAAYFKKSGGDAQLQSWAGFSAGYTRIFGLGGLAVLLVTGVIMILQSDEEFEFSEAWISLAFLVWFAIGGVMSAMTLKGEKAVAAGDMSSLPKIVRGGQIVGALGILMLYLMVFKPGA